jgi:hypothetical protein
MMNSPVKITGKEDFTKVTNRVLKYLIRLEPINKLVLKRKNKNHEKTIELIKSKDIE